MTMSANHQRATQGISSALDVPVTSGSEYVKRARVLMAYGERGWRFCAGAAAFCSSAEGMTVVIGPSSEGREKDQRGKRWSRVRESGALSDIGLWHLHCVVYSLEC